MSDAAQLGEFDLIDKIQSRLKRRSARIKLGIGDDCAVIDAPGNHYEIVTTDALIESVHFDLSTTAPRQLGRKSQSVNISDIAAMGGTPHTAFLTLGIPPKLPARFLDQFFLGFNERCREYKIELAGGDTVSSPKHLFINVTLLGQVKKNRLFTRDGARPGDRIFVTGSLGDSALGLKILQSPEKKWAASAKNRAELIKAHVDPTPRLRESRILAQSKLRVTSMIDVSDGLAQDLHHLCRRGNLGARLDQDKLPKSKAMEKVCQTNNLNPLPLILSGGEDYELLFTLKSEDVKKLLRRFHEINTPLALIGEVTAKSGEIFLQRNDGSKELLKRDSGFDHFRSFRKKRIDRNRKGRL